MSRTIKDVLDTLEQAAAELRLLLYGHEAADVTVSVDAHRLPASSREKLRKAAAMLTAGTPPRRRGERREKAENDELLRTAIATLRNGGKTTATPADMARAIGMKTGNVAFIYERLRLRPEDFGLSPAGEFAGTKQYRIGRS